MNIAKYKVGQLVKFEMTFTSNMWTIDRIENGLYYIHYGHTYTAVPKYHIDWYNGGIRRERELL